MIQAEMALSNANNSIQTSFISLENAQRVFCSYTGQDFAKPALVNINNPPCYLPDVPLSQESIDKLAAYIRAPGTSGADVAVFMAIMGASGSAKSTIMNVIGCLDRPTAGRYEFEDRDVGSLSDDGRAALRSREFGFIFQQFNLLPRMSAIEQVELPMVFQHGTQRRRRAKEALARVGLADRMKHTPTQLSGGQQQRVAIARALAVQPRVVLADEPTGALDTHTGEEVMGILEDLVRSHGITVILVTHEQSVADYADRVVRMRDGKVVEDTNKKNLAAAAAVR